MKPFLRIFLAIFLLFSGSLYAQEEEFEAYEDDVQYADTQLQAVFGNLTGFGAGLYFKIYKRVTSDVFFGIRAPNFMLSPYPDNRINFLFRVNYELGRFYTNLGWYYGTYGLAEGVSSAQLNSITLGFGGYLDKKKLWTVEIGVAPWIPSGITAGGREFTINGADPCISYMVRRKFREAKKPEVKGVY